MPLGIPIYIATGSGRPGALDRPAGGRAISVAWPRAPAPLEYLWARSGPLPGIEEGMLPLDVVGHDPESTHVPPRRPILEASGEELRAWMAERGHPAYRARQVIEWVVRRRAESF